MNQRLGRPPLPEEEVRSERLTKRLTKSEKKMIDDLLEETRALDAYRKLNEQEQ